MSEIMRAFFAIIGALIVIYFSTRFASYLGQAADGKIAPHHISLLLLLKMLVSLKDLIPMSLYLGIFAAVIRLQRDVEIVAMRAAGAGHALLIFASLKIAAPAAVIVCAITLYAEPRAEQAFKDIRDQTENEATIAGVKAGQFKELSGGKRIFYAESVSTDEKTLNNAFVRSLQASSVGLMRSDVAFVETEKTSGDRFAVFLQGSGYSGTPGGLDYVITDFDRYALRIDNRLPTTIDSNVNYMLTGELLKYRGADFAAEFQWRLAAPIATLLLPTLAILIGVSGQRGNWHLGLLFAVSSYFIYSNTLGVGKALIRKGVLPPGIGLWSIHAVLILIVGLLLYIERRPRGLRRHATQELIHA